MLLERRFLRDKNKQIHSDVDALRARISESLRFYHEFLAPKAAAADFVVDTHKDVVYKKTQSKKLT